MEESTQAVAENWVWGALGVLYGLFYAKYFARLARRLKPDLRYVKVPGSPERLRAKRAICLRFALLMVIPTLLEFARPSYFTASFISFAPALFGLWVMRSVWVEVLHSKIPASTRVSRQR